MTTAPAAAPTRSSFRDGISNWSGKLDLLWPFFCLALVEAVAFGINARNVGVYQDEWIYFGKMHFVPHTLLNVISAFFWDERVIVRPIEALYYGTLYFFAWEKPLLYHVACYVTEFLGGWFLFLAVARLGRNRAAGFAAALLFLLYPNHDSTHYFITASVEQVSSSLFTLSLWLFLKGVDERRHGLVLWSGFAYLLSIYYYEQTLPLLVVYPLLSFLTLRGAKIRTRSVRLHAAYQIPFVLAAASMLLYRCWLLPSLHIGWRYTPEYSVSHFFTVIAAGVNVSLSPYVVSFCASMISNELKEGLPAFSWLCLAVAVTAVLACSFREAARPAPGSNAFPVIFLGAVTLIFSYTIFGVSGGHMPEIDTWLNRVNICGSLGTCLILGGLLGLAQNSPGSPRKLVGAAAVAVVLSVITGSFILVGWQFARTWAVSWQAQKQLMAFMRGHRADIKPGDSIIIGGITRYASKWAPVVDGTWDFQSIVRTTLNTREVNANVVTNRLTVTGDALVDRSGTLVLGTYPFKQMILYDPSRSKWLRISSRKEFFERASELGWVVADSEPTRRNF